jgi:phosphatidate cytidylyltransferase
VNNFIQRTLTGAVFVVVIIGSLLWNNYAFTAVFAVFTTVGLWEFYSLLKKNGISISRIFPVIVGFLIYAGTFLSLHYFKITESFSLIIASVFALSVVMFFVELFSKKEKPFEAIGYSFLGLIYIAVPFTLLVNIPFIKDQGLYSPELVLGIFLMLWANDTFAYLTGMLIGKHKLFERISPKKTWEGFFGGLAFTLIVAFAFSLKYDYLSLLQWLILAAIIVVSGTLGDLVESMLKRSIGCKDSGNFFPGHGGILDRFDSILLSVPFVYLFLMILL